MRAARQRAWGVFFAFAIGLIAGREFDGVAVWAWASAGVAAIALHPVVRAVLRGRAGVVLVLIGAASLGGAWAHHRLHTLPPNHPAALLEPAPAGDTRLVRVRGVLDRDPQRDAREASPFDAPGRARGATRLDVRLTEIDAGDGWIPAVGRVVVRANTLEATVPRAGDGVRALGRFTLPGPGLNPGEPDWVLLARQGGFAGVLQSTPDLIEPDADATSALSGWWSLRARVRAAASRMLGIDPDRAGELEPGQAVLLALVLGERTDELEPISTAFARTGTAHLLAISGFHLGVLALALVLVLRLTGERGGWEAAAVACGVVLILVLVPVRPPIARAALLVALLLGAESVGRRYDKLTLLAWIGVLLLAWRPLDVASLGFQLSLGVTALLLLYADPNRRVPTFLHDTGIGLRLQRGVVGTVRTYAACWAIGVPTIAFATGICSPIAPIAALVLTPVIVVAVALGYVALPIALVLPGLGELVAALGAWLGAMASALSAFFDRLPLGSFEVPRVSAAWAIGATVLIGFALCAVRSRWMPRVVAIAAAAGWLALEVALAPALPRHVVARLDTLAVGDGTCHVLRSGPSAMLIDAGSLTPGLGERSIPEALRALGVVRAPIVLLTHANLDHYNALPELIQPLGVERVLTTEAFVSAGGAVPALLALLEAAGVEVITLRAGDQVTLGELRGEVLWPPADVPTRPLSANDTSLVVRFDVPTDDGSRSVLITGDVQRAAIAGLLERGMPAVDVLELPHHGSFTPEAVAFVRAVDPAAVHQSTGPSRLLGDRWGALAADRAWFVTARDGAIWSEITRDGRLRGGAVLAAEP